MIDVCRHEPMPPQYYARLFLRQRDVVSRRVMLRRVGESERPVRRREEAKRGRKSAPMRLFEPRAPMMLRVTAA